MYVSAQCALPAVTWAVWKSEVIGEILGGVRKEGTKMMPFHSEDSQALKQVGWRVTAVFFLGSCAVV